MIGQIGSGTMDYFYIPSGHHGNVLIGKHNVVGGQKIGVKYTHRLQKLGRAQMVILKAEADLILVLTQMGMNSGVKFSSSSIPCHGDQNP